MIYQPKQGQIVLIRYRPSMRQETGLHMTTATILTVASGHKTKNCLVSVVPYGIKVVVPRGNLFKIDYNHGF